MIVIKLSESFWVGPLVLASGGGAAGGEGVASGEGGTGGAAAPQKTPARSRGMKLTFFRGEWTARVFINYDFVSTGTAPSTNTVTLL